MLDITIRRAVPDDADAVVAFWLAAGENESRPADDVDEVLRLLARDPEAMLLAIDEGCVVGSVIAGWDGWRAHLYRLAVLPERRRQGIANLLLTSAELHLATLGAARFDAMVLERNTLGRSAWGARGYAPQPDWRRWVRPAR